MVIFIFPCLSPQVIFTLLKSRGTFSFTRASPVLKSFLVTGRLGRDGMHKGCAGLSQNSFSQNRVGGVFLDAWEVAQPGQPGQRGEVGTAKQMSSQMAEKSEGLRKGKSQEICFCFLGFFFCLCLSPTPCISLNKSLNIPTEATLKHPLLNSVFPSRKWKTLDQNFLNLTVYLPLCRAHGTFWKKHFFKKISPT